MSWLPIGANAFAHRQNSSEAQPPRSGISSGLLITGLVLRTSFIVSLLIVTVHVSLPQSATIWTAYDTPGDLMRMILGLAVCVWISIQVFAVPKDAQAYRTWLYLGPFAIPFALICIVGLW